MIFVGGVRLVVSGVVNHLGSIKRICVARVYFVTRGYLVDAMSCQLLGFGFWCVVRVASAGAGRFELPHLPTPG